MRRQNTTYHYMLDALGSVRKLTDANQATTDSYSYEAFGSIVASSGSTTNPYRYVGSLGYYRDSTSGLLHVGARYYSPEVGGTQPTKQGLLSLLTGGKGRYGHTACYVKVNSLGRA
jgi:hypothetical protein